MQQAHVIFNPSSGSYSVDRQQQILFALNRGGISAKPYLPFGEQETMAVVRELCVSQKLPLIVAVGGDGTINTVINGMQPQRATLGVIPLGTANVLAWELGIKSIEEAVQRLATGTPRPFSVGEVTTANGSRRFLLMAGIGIDGAVVAGVRNTETRRLGKLAYLLSAIREIWRWDASLLAVNDGQRSCSCHSVIVANAAHYGGPYRLAQQTDMFSEGVELVPL